MPDFSSKVKSLANDFEMPKNVESKLTEVGNKIENSLGNVFDSTETMDLSVAEAPVQEEKLITVDGNRLLDCDPQGIADKFGGQADDNGVYPRAEGDCDNYARGYCLYAQTGEVADFNDIGAGGCGLERYTNEAGNRKEQAQFVFDRLTNDGKPAVIHVPSVTGNGHWMCAVGVKDGVSREDVTIGDLIVIDSAGNWGEENSAKVMPVSDNSYYCEEGTENMLYDPGYQVIYFD